MAFFAQHKVYSVLLVCCFLACSIPVGARTIDKEVDLKGGIMQLELNEQLCIERGGRIYNGTIIGDQSSIRIRSNRAWVLNNIILEGTWVGMISDKVFKYRAKSKQHWGIISSMFRFDTLSFSKRDYYLERWETIRMKSGDVLIEGNGVELILPSDKGTTISTRWGDRYKKYNLFVSSREDNTTLTVRNLSILDNRRITPHWGEDVATETPVLYFYFAPEQANILFENVLSDGCGALLHTYNTDKENGLMVFRNCHIKTSQFGIELGNRNTSHTNKIVIEDCSVRRYKNATLVGPVSIVGGNHQVDTVIIRNCEFHEPNVGNIEVSGADYVFFCGNTTTNMFCYTGSIPPIKYVCSSNKITMCSGETGRLGVAMNIAGETIEIKGNSFIITEKPFPFITVRQPEMTKFMSVADNTVVYEPLVNNNLRQYLFLFEKVPGAFEFYGNRLESSYTRPCFSNYLPSKMKRYEGDFDGRVVNYLVSN